MAEETKSLQYLDYSKFNLYTDVPNTTNARARLTWGMSKENPRITVFTNDPNDPVSHKAIGFGFTYENFLIFLTQLEEMAKSPNNTHQKMQFTVRPTDPNTASIDRTVVSTLLFGKDDRGIVWIGIHAENRPKLKFEIQMSNWNKLYNKEGQQIDPALTSVATTLAIVNGLRQAYGYMLGHYFVNPTIPPKTPNNGSTDNRYKQNTPMASSAFEDVAF